MKHFTFFLLLLLSLLNIFYLLLQNFNPQDTTIPESVFAYISFEASKGNKIYKDFNEFPFIISPYPPLYYLFLSFLIKIFNLNLENIFYIGRIFNYLIFIVLLIISYFYLRRKGSSKFTSAFSIFLILSNFILFPWVVTLRSDIFALFFSIAGFLAYKNVFFCLVFSLISFFFKPSFISLPVSIFLIYFFEKKYKKGFLFLFLYISLIFILIFILNLKTNNLFYKNVFEANIAPLEFKNLRSVFGFFLSQSILMLPFAIYGLLNLNLKNPLSIYFLVSISFSIFTSLKLGSNTNYFLETIFLSTFLCAKGIEEILKNNGKIIFSFTIIPLVFFINIRINNLETLKYNYEENIREIVKNLDGIILTDTPRLGLLSKEPFFLDPFNLNYLEKKGKWSSEKIIKMIKNGEIKVFIFSAPLEKPLTWQKEKRIPEKILNLVKEEAYFYSVIDNYYVYYKKP